MSPTAKNTEERAQIAHDFYDAPRVEKILSAEQLEREVLYAGFGGTTDPVVDPE